ncbi:MAG TPA: recombinase RecA [Caldisericia bacterium]|nr:recombinase RecA [Caldisericia bacterium]
MAKEKVLGNNLNKASNLMERLLKNSTLKHAARLDESEILNEIPAVPTRIPMLNLALNGRIDGGIERGLTMLAGPSKSFKTSFSLEMISAYLKAKPNAVCLFFDGEFGAKKSYFEQFDVPTHKILHLPFENIEELKFEMANQLTNVELGEDVICFVDSIGNAASKKEVEDSIDQKSVADLSRAKSLASLFRIITPKLYLKRIPCIIVNHTMKTMDFYPVDLPKGGNGGIYSSNTIWLIGKNKLKEKEEHTGYKFLIKMYKSRDIKDNAMFPITVRFEGGIAKWSGLDELALQLGIIEKCKEGRSSAYQYQSISGEIFKVLEKDVDVDDAFWERIFKETDFQYRVECLYQFGKHSEDKVHFDSSEVDEIIKNAVVIDLNKPE